MLSRFKMAGALLLVLLFASVTAGQVHLGLDRIGERVKPDLTAAHLGEHVVVEGTVASSPAWALQSWFYLSIEDQAGYGVLLMAEAPQFAGLERGDRVQVQGVVGERGGMPVLRPEKITRLGHQEPLPPKRLSIAELNGFRYLGLAVETSGLVTAVGVNAGGDVITISDRGSSLTVFLPRARRDPAGGFRDIAVGDRVRVAGLASQYSPIPPHDRFFQVLAPAPSAVVVVERRSPLPPFLLLTSLGAIAALLAIWWARERRMAVQRRNMRALHALSEEIIAAGSAGEVLSRLAAVLPDVIQAAGVRIYVYNRRTKSLERVTSAADPEPMAVSLDSPPAGVATAVAVCFRNRSLLNVPDLRRSPFQEGAGEGTPRALMFVPMFAQRDLLGVLEVDAGAAPHSFTQEEQAAAQHVANQAGASLKLQEQQSIREQLFRSEKLAATGQLISGVASELRQPLGDVLELARALPRRPADPVTERQLTALHHEAQHALEIVRRLVSFGSAGRVEAKPLEINGLLSSLMQFREREWQASGLRIETSLAPEPLWVLGAQGQLEQVFLSLLIHAEQSAAARSDGVIRVASSAVGKRVLVEIAYPGASARNADPFAEPDTQGSGGLGLGVCRGIVQSHGGEVRFRTHGGWLRFEVDLPVAKPAAEETETAAEVRKTTCALTMLVVEPDLDVRRQLVGVLGSRGHRAVPVVSPEEALDLAFRLRFDALFCAARLLGTTAADLHERVRDRTSAFVLVANGGQSEAAGILDKDDILVLGWPVEQAAIDHVLAVIGERAEAKTRS